MSSAKKALTQTTETTKSLFASLGDIEWISKAVSIVGGQQKSDRVDGQAEFLRQGCHPFYEDIIEDGFPSFVSCDL